MIGEKAAMAKLNANKANVRKASGEPGADGAGSGGWSGLGRVAAAAAVGSLVVLGGCATTQSTEVTTFHQLPAADALAGRSFVVVADAGQKDSLEFASYADAVGQALQRHGLVAAPPGRTADYAVGLRYGTSLAEVRQGGGSRFGVGVSGGGFSLGGLGIGIGLGIPIGGSSRSSSLYRHELAVDINAWAPGAGRGAGSGQPAPAPGARLFEGRAVAENASEAITPVMPALVEALFDGFPGANGSTRNVEVRLAR